MQWLTYSWWKYLFESRNLQNAWCRAHGHPSGMIYFRTGEASSPDTRCIDCEEDIG